jgi:hypothetical protein
MAAPNLTVQIQGQGAVGADQFNTFEQTCDNFSQLKAFVGIAGVQVYARGASAPGDGYQGEFYWNSNSTSVDDNGITTLTPSGFSSTTPGRWLRLPSTVSLTPVYTVAQLIATWPPSASIAGLRATVSDALTPTFLAALTGSSTTVCPAFCNGVAWVAG